jgi:hypothetical protein
MLTVTPSRVAIVIRIIIAAFVLGILGLFLVLLVAR